MPNSWEVRTRKRQAAVDYVKSTKEHKAYQASGDVTVEPLDPLDLSIRKRGWEARVMAWRKELKGYAGDDVSDLLNDLLGLWADSTDGSFYWLTANTSNFIDV